MPNWFINLGEFMLVLALAFVILIGIILAVDSMAPSCGADGQLLPDQMICNGVSDNIIDKDRKGYTVN